MGYTRMDYDDLGEFSLKNISEMNVVLGKNGCGKSHLLKAVAQQLRGMPYAGLVRYISPERAGYAVYEPNVEHNISSNPTWMDQVRGNNQSENFKQQSAVLYRRLETMVLREIETDRALPGFDGTVEKINGLLDRVKIERAGSTFKIVERSTNTETNARAISSGESELLSLAIEMLAFLKECVAGKTNFLLVDEPDVHLHPDLQHRLAQFVIDTLKADNISVVVATHSTALLSAFAGDDMSRVAFMRRGDTSLQFHGITEAYRHILPIFGAHPLSNVFNEAPILLIEGEDDERIWQQAIRSGKGAIRAFPCVVDGLPNMAEYERDSNELIESVYDNARGYSIRDRDAAPVEIEDVGRITRMRLCCRTAENLMLADDTLATIGKDWATVQAAMSAWLGVNSTHVFFEEVKQFVEGGLNRKAADLKKIRNIIVGLMTNKPWEVLVGQAIAKLALDGGGAEEHSLRDYLGPKICKELLGI